MLMFYLNVHIKNINAVTSALVLSKLLCWCKQFINHLKCVNLYIVGMTYCNCQCSRYLFFCISHLLSSPLE